MPQGCNSRESGGTMGIGDKTLLDRCYGIGDQAAQIVTNFARYRKLLRAAGEDQRWMACCKISTGLRLWFCVGEPLSFYLDRMLSARYP